MFIGSISKFSKQIKDLKKGSIVEVKIKTVYGFGDQSPKRLVVTSRNLVKKGTIDKITLRNVKNPKGVKYFFYIRNGKPSMAMGDLAVSVTDFKVLSL